jgi:histone H3/H4
MSGRNIKVVKDAEWKRLSEKAGIATISGYHCYPYLQDVCHKFIKNVLNKALIYMEYANRKTLYPEDVTEAINISGYSKMFVNPKSNTKTCKIYDARDARDAMTSVRQYQKLKQLPKKPFHEFTPPNGSYLSYEMDKFREYQQQSDCFMIAKKPFHDFIKDEIQPVRISHDALIILQYAFESFALSILKAGAEAMAHAKRVTLFVDDLKFVVNNLSSNCAKIILK